MRVVRATALWGGWGTEMTEGCPKEVTLPSGGNVVQAERMACTKATRAFKKLAKKLKMELPFDPAIPLPGLYPKIVK